MIKFKKRTQVAKKANTQNNYKKTDKIHSTDRILKSVPKATRCKNKITHMKVVSDFVSNKKTSKIERLSQTADGIRRNDPILTLVNQYKVKPIKSIVPIVF